MHHTPKQSQTGPKAGLATAGLGALAVVCCAGAPLIVGALGGIAVGGVLGVGAGVLTMAVACALIVRRIRDRQACAVAHVQGPADERHGGGS